MKTNQANDSKYNRAVAYYAVKKISETLKITSPEVYFNASNFFPHKEVSSMYIQIDNAIVFNKSWIKHNNFIEVAATAIHETRHAYQAYCVKHHVYESDETIQSWKECFRDYNTPIESLDPKDNIDYLNQSIEIDAVAFSYHIMLDWFDVKLDIPKEIRNKVQKRIEEISKSLENY